MIEPKFKWKSLQSDLESAKNAMKTNVENDALMHLSNSPMLKLLFFLKRFRK